VVSVDGAQQTKQASGVIVEARDGGGNSQRGKG
jgi:hypothetical protein